jgi:hypothetical protein
MMAVDSTAQVVRNVGGLWLANAYIITGSAHLYTQSTIIDYTNKLLSPFKISANSLLVYISRESLMNKARVRQVRVLDLGWI